MEQLAIENNAKCQAAKCDEAIKLAEADGDLEHVACLQHRKETYLDEAKTAHRKAREFKAGLKERD